MDVDLYKDDSLPKRVFLDFGDMVLTVAEVQENLTLSQSVNTGSELTLGSACASELSFDVLDYNGTIQNTDIAGKEFHFWIAAQTSQQSKLDVYRTARKDIILPYDTWVFGGDSRNPYLSVWKDHVQMDNVPQPDKPVKALFYVDGNLYCGHDESPYVTAYSVSETQITKLSSPSLSAFQIEQVIGFCGQSASWALSGELLKEYSKEYSNQIVSDFVENTFTLQTMGFYIAEKPERKNERVISVKAYDRMTKFDVPVAEWFSELSFPISLKSLLQSLCSEVGIPLVNVTFPNQDYQVSKTIEADDITGREMLQWIAEAAARFAYITPTGSLTLSWYTDLGYITDYTQYFDLSFSDYQVQKIDKVQIKVTENDIGVIVGTGSNTYVISDNPLLYAESDSQLRSAATEIFNAIKDFSYLPYQLKIRGNPLIQPGEIITVNTKKGKTVKAVIMSKKLSGVMGLTDEMEAVGSERRPIQVTETNRQITTLKGKTNELTRTVDETISRLYDSETGDISVLKQTASSLTASVESINGDISSLEQTASSLTASVESIDGEISSINIDLSGIHTSVSNLQGDVSSVTQTANSIEAAVNSTKVSLTENDGLTIYNGGLHVNNGSYDVMYFDTSGNLSLSGNITGSNITGSSLSWGSGNSINNSGGYTEIRAVEDITIYSGRGDITLGGPAGDVIIDYSDLYVQTNLDVYGDLYVSSRLWIGDNCEIYIDSKYGQTGTFTLENGTFIRVTRGIITEIS